MAIRSRLPKEKGRSMASKIGSGLGAVAEAYWNSLPAGNEPSFEKTAPKPVRQEDASQ